jgi:putative thioredoxin
MTTNTAIVTIDETNFATEVLEKSHDVPVLADFWADWCSPCQMLLPILSELATEYQGQFILAKINSDEQTALARKYNVRSLPTLKLFRDGEVVEEIVGAQPESVFRQLIDKYIKRASDKLRPRALMLSDTGDHAAAIELLEQALASEADHSPLQADFLRVLLNAHEYERAETLLHSLPANIQSDDEFKALASQLHYSKMLNDAPNLSDLEQQINQNPDDLNSLYQLALRQMQTGAYQAAMDNFLNLMRKNRQFGDDAGRKGMLAVFELLDKGNPLLNQYRSKLSSLLY